MNDTSRKTSLRRPMKVGTWNTQSLYEVGKLANLVLEMNRLKLDILGIAETWGPGADECMTEHGKFFYSGNEDRNHRKGVGIVITKKLMRSVVELVPYSDRAALLKLQAKPIDLNIIQVYAPTAAPTEQEIDRFNSEIKELLKLTKKHDVNIIMGDFNVKIGEGKFENIVGPYQLGVRNERGDRLLQFCQEDTKITNTWFQFHPRRLYTWKSPANKPQNIVRN